MLITNGSEQIRFESLFVLGAVIVAVVFLNFIPVLSTIFRRLFTMIHELGHVIATAVSGGQVEGFRVLFKPKDGVRGFAEWKGGDSSLIFSAGYLGVTLFSAGLMLLSTLPYIAPYTLAFLGAILLWAVLDLGRGKSTIILGLFFGVGFILVAWLANLVWSIFLLNLVAIQGGLIALDSLQEVGQAVCSNTSDKDDASKTAALFNRWPFRLSMFWVRVWSISSILILGTAFWFTWFRALTE